MGIVEVGKNIKELRMQKGITQKGLGEAVGKGDSQIGAYEQGKADVPLSVLFDLASALGVQPEILITGKTKETKKPKWDAELQVFNQEDRLMMIQILAKNGYDVGQHKRYKTPTGKTMVYYIHATLLEDNANTAK